VRYDTEHKQQTRTRVLDAAASAIRLSGPDKVGVAGVMAEAGLTHGGFYAHFSSKDDLVTAAIEHMFEQARARFRHETEGRTTAEGLIAYIDFYLSKKHRDARNTGCPIPTLASDLPRLTEAARAIYAEGVQRLAVRLTAMLTELGHANAEAQARSIVAELIGALLLARVEPDTKRSDAILAASKRQVKERLGLEARA
jgi:TetR/AcrR family transcriptional repressor of nem operon